METDPKQWKWGPEADDLTFRRQEAIDVLLRLQGCTDSKTSKCEHLAAITDLILAAYLTVGVELVETLAPSADRKGRIKLYQLAGLVAGMSVETRIRPGVEGQHREGKL